MSGVIGLVTQTGVLLAAESCATDGSVTITLGEEKIVKVYSPLGVPIGLAYSGPICVGGALRYDLKIPEEEPFPDVDEYVYKHLRPALRAAIQEERPSDSDMQIIIAVGGNLYNMDPDYAVFKCGLGYHAIGTAKEIGLGALYALDCMEDAIEESAIEKYNELRAAIVVAAMSDLSTYAHGDAVIVNIPRCGDA